MKNLPRIEKIVQRDLAVISELVAIWEKSVWASHDFLSETDIVNLKPYVEAGISGIENLIVVKIDNAIVGFMGINSDKIEMLFLSPQHFGRGLGRQLVSCGIAEYGVGYVDVNEQNPLARRFYEKAGFTLYQRDPLDGQGKPFPILKMRLKSSDAGKIGK